MHICYDMLIVVNFGPCLEAAGVFVLRVLVGFGPCVLTVLYVPYLLGQGVSIHSTYADCPKEPDTYIPHVALASTYRTCTTRVEEGLDA